MATFTNQATLSYNGVVTSSNVTVGELLEAVKLTKTAVTGSYRTGENVAYVVSAVNSGTVELTGLTLSDDLGAYTFNSRSLVPLTYVADSVKYYVNGTLQPAPTVSAGPPLTVSGLSIPAGGNAIIVYEARPNQFAPLGSENTVVNTATLSGASLTSPLTGSETIAADGTTELNVSKALSPATVTENAPLTYTFTIQNTGNTAVAAGSDIVLSDTFDPALNISSVTFNGAAWASPANYAYDRSTGVFSTVAGQITVPAATYAQDPVTGVWSVTPGVSTLVITGVI